MRLRGLGAQKCAGQIHRHHAIPRVFRGFQRGSVGQNPGAVEQDVQIAQFLDGALHYRTSCGCETSSRAKGFPAPSANLVGRFLAAALAGIGHHHGRTFARKADGHRPGNAGSGAGNQRDLRGKPHIILQFGPGDREAA